MDHAKQWMSAKDAQERLVKTWQDLEHALSLRIRSLALDLDEAMHSDLSEARTMRALMRQIERYDRSLNRLATCIAKQRSASAAGALAKIEVALRMYYPTTCEEDAWVLISSAAHDLRELASADNLEALP